MDKSRAVDIALQGFAWASGQDEVMSAFFAQTGSDPAALRGAAERPEFLGFVLDFLLGQDEWVRGCADAIGEDPANLAIARAYLPGGEAEMRDD